LQCGCTNAFLWRRISKKEFIELISGSAEADRVFEAMVASGHLDQPAQGFIFTRNVDVGLINTMSFENTTPYPATMEQIIKAIDQMQGNTRWRSTGIVKSGGAPKRKMLKNLISLNCIVRRGFGDACSLVAMEAGDGGTSTYYATATPIEQSEGEDIGGTDEREIIALTIGEKQVNPVVQAITSMPQLAGHPLRLPLAAGADVFEIASGSSDDGSCGRAWKTSRAARPPICFTRDVLQATGETIERLK